MAKEVVVGMEKLSRYIIFIIGLYINSLGVSLVTKANLGTSPISSIPYVLSLNFPMTLGEFTILFSVLLILLQLAILRRDFKLEHALQIPVSIVFGYFIDFSMILLSFVDPQTYVMKVVYLLVGCVILGIGVYIEVLANVVMLPGESFVRAIVFKWKKDFGVTKIVFDFSMSVGAAALSFIFAGELAGVREGTVIAALLVGFIARLIGRKLSFLPGKIFASERGEETAGRDGSEDTAGSYGAEDTAGSYGAECIAGRHELGGVSGIHCADNEPDLCIVIGRQYGSGGHDIGKKLADELGFKFYDKEIIQMAAGTTGYDSSFIIDNEEIMSHSLLYDLINQVYLFSDDDAPRDNIFAAETKAIKEIAAKGNSVIVGRCADYILLNKKNCISVFLYAPTKFRINRIMETEGLTEESARKKIRQIDKQRADHYRYYTNQIWGMAANYHVCVDTSFGYESVERVIMEAIKGYMQ